MTTQWAVLDIRGEQNYGRIVSVHHAEDKAWDACEATIERQTAGMSNATTHLMWTVAQVDGNVGDRVGYKAH